MGVGALQFRSPEWNFAQYVAASPLNEEFQVESSIAIKDSASGLSKTFTAPTVLKQAQVINYSYAKKLPQPRKGFFYCKWAGQYQVFETYFDATVIPTPFHQINNQVVVSVKNTEEQEKTRFKQFDPDELSQPSEYEILSFIDQEFNKKMTKDICNWDAMFRNRLLTIFRAYVSGFAMCMILANFSYKSFTSTPVKTATALLLVTGVAFAALSMLVSVRLLQFYSLQMQHKNISNAAHWLVHLWQAVQIDPTLLQKHPDLGAFFNPPSDRPSNSLKSTPVVAQEENQLAARREVISAAAARRLGTTAPNSQRV